MKKFFDFVQQKFKKASPLFHACVTFPVLIATLYFGIFASDIYISESRFLVRGPEKAQPAGLGVLLKSAGFTNSGDEIYAAHDFVVSRDALREVNRGNAFERAYGSSHVSLFDRFNPLGLSGSFEDLYRYYETKVQVDHNSTSSITTLTVRAYSPQDAQRTNEKLLELAEGTVNRLSARGRDDLIRFSQREVEDAAEKARVAALALSAYRNRVGVVDPEKQATVQLQMISKLQDELIATRNQLSQLRSVTPGNPQIGMLQSKEADLTRAIDQQNGLVAGDARSLSSTAARYQRLQLESQVADRQLASAMSSLDTARNDARRKFAYVERIVQPNQPDRALEPRRLRGIIATLVLGLIAWGILSMLLAGVREHWE